MDNAIHATAKQFGRVFGTQVLWLESLADLGVEGFCAKRMCLDSLP
jgi:DNA-directed RNA polymerase subunit N (RpoN/RPB10)